ncbi:protein that induces appearance of [PIN+] prion when overproduced [Savitreella phatthalungensis]
MTDQAYVNRIIGNIYTDLGYLVDVGVITDGDYDEITKRIPRRFRGQPKLDALPDIGQLNVASSSNTSEAKRRVPGVPSPAAGQTAVVHSTPTPEPIPVPLPVGIAQAEALYDYNSGDPGDLDFRTGDRLIVMEFMNADWWRGKKDINGKEGLFPSNYVRKTSDQGRSPLEQVPLAQAQQYPPAPMGQQGFNPQDYRPVQYAPAQGPGQQSITVVENKKTGKLNRIGGQLGNAAVTGAGFAVGASLVNAIL